MADVAESAPLPKVGFPAEQRETATSAEPGFTGHIGSSAIDGLRAIVSADPQFFTDAIHAREADGLILENRLVRIDRSVIEAASIENRIARITIRFEADIAGVTRDRDGQIVAGSLSDAVPTRDLWTFSRNVRDSNPNWMLVETDEAA